MGLWIFKSTPKLGRRYLELENVRKRPQILGILILKQFPIWDRPHFLGSEKVEIPERGVLQARLSRSSLHGVLSGSRVAVVAITSLRWMVWLVGGFKHGFYFPYGMSSFQLTNLYFSRWLKQPVWLFLFFLWVAQQWVIELVEKLCNILCFFSGWKNMISRVSRLLVIVRSIKLNTYNI